ncbi:MAG: carbohydrate ABC transporter substrate-binding protein [Clostridiales bacterium]|nr:carbohydrate ABC transporter substrate-binding protein [Clostridiales bacterium]
MMKKKRLVALALAATMTVSSAAIGGLVGCGSKKSENELWITYFKGGYGSEWVEQLARKFEAEHDGVTVRTDGDTQLIDAVPNMMKNGTDYDLIFCHDVTWEDFVAPGQIYCLDDLYATEVDDKGTTFADRIWDDDVLASARYDGHYYKVPWTIGTAGIAYNMTVMDRVDSWLEKQGETRKWNRTAPVDYYELLQYCKDINDAHLLVDPNEADSGIITPFTWSGVSEEWQWDYVLFDWWGQLAGPETMNTFKNFGNVDENFNLDTSKQNNPDKEVYNPEKFAVVRNADGTVDKENSTYVGWAEYQQAYQLWYDLVCGENKSWSTSKISNMSKFENEQAFASGAGAMTPAACWIEYESKLYLERYGQEVSIMPTPIISNVKLDAEGKVLPKDATDAAKTIDAIHADAGVTEKTITVNGNTYNRVSFTSSFGDSVMIPAKSTGRDLAVEFLLFMQKEENAQLFTKLSGGTVLPYKYNYWDSFVEDGVDKATAWQKSIFEIDRNSTKFNNYTQHPMMRKTDLRGSARMTTIWPTNSYFYLKAWQGAEPTATEKSSGLQSYKPTDLIPYLYDKIITARWETYKKDL